jgi:hypothetical protein
MKTPFLLTGSLALLLSTAPTPVALPQGAEPGRERPERAELERRERAEEGQHFEAQADQARHIEQLQAELERLQAAGKTEQAAELRQHLAELKRQLAREHPEERPPFPERAAIKAKIAELHRVGRHDEAQRLEREWQGERPPQPLDRLEGGPPELQLRLHHLTIAIEHLHLAGFHEPAERLEREAQQLKLRARDQAMREERDPRRDRPGPNPEELQAGLEKLRAELEEMRHAFRDINARLEKLQRER